MTRVICSLLLASVLFGCPKDVPINVAGSDDEQMDQYSAQLEEFRTREMKCPEWCDLKGKICGLSKAVCEISGKHADRSDLQKKCTSSQEDCARFNDGCGTCGK